MKFSYLWLKNIVPFRESPERLAELLTLRSFEVETIEKRGKDWVLDIKLPANRISDAASHIGLAREIAAITKSKIKFLAPKWTTPKNNTRPQIRIKITDKKLVPRYTAQILEIKKLRPSPLWMQRRLISCGFRPINAIVDVTNFVMLEMGQPLHAFDLGKINGNTLTVRETRKGEQLITLNGTSHVLPSGALVIEDENRLIDLAGIMGGQNSSIGEHSSRILLQAAVFDQTRIYRASRDLNFSTDASKIYAAGIDTEGTAQALARAVLLLQEILHAESKGFIDIYPYPVKTKKILFHSEYANRIIGESLPVTSYEHIFKDLGFAVEKRGKENLAVAIPSRRKDLTAEEDLIEEAARLFGYERIAPKPLPSYATPPARNDELRWEEKIKDFLATSGFTESKLYEFTGEKELRQYGRDNRDVIRIKNPISPESEYLTPRILFSFITSAGENLKHFERVALFGIAKSFRKTQNKKTAVPGIDEHKDLVILLGQKENPKGDTFYELKGICDALFEKLGITDHTYDDNIPLDSGSRETLLFHPYRLAEIKLKNDVIGAIGEIHPDILERIKIRVRLVAIEIIFGKLWQYANAEKKFDPIGKFPAAVRDIAVVIPETVKTETILNIIKNSAEEPICDFDLFDYFQDEAMRGKKEKSLAFHLTFQSAERTLTDEEINKILARITHALEENNWKVRK